MVQVLEARAVTLRDLIDNFGLELVQNDQFFLEWQENLPELTEFEQQFLNKVKQGFFNLVTDPPVLEKPLQLAITAPLLFLADFYLPPFQVKAEESVEMTGEDEGVLIRDSLDVLVLKDRLWMLVIESKRLSFSVEAGLAQLISYMLGTPERNRPCYGLVTNGASFLFVKLLQGETPRYATSNQFNIRDRGNSLYDILKILKRLSQL